MQHTLVLFVEAVIGLRNETYIVNEPDGPITVYVEFLSPDQISEDVVIDLAIVTRDDTAFGKHSLYLACYCR